MDGRRIPTEEDALNVVVEAWTLAERFYPPGKRFFRARLSAVDVLRRGLGLRVAYKAVTRILEDLGYTLES